MISSLKCFGFENPTVVMEGDSAQGLSMAVRVGSSEKATKENQPVKAQHPSLSTHCADNIKTVFPDSAVRRTFEFGISQTTTTVPLPIAVHTSNGSNILRH